MFRIGGWVGGKVNSVSIDAVFNPVIEQGETELI